MKHFSAVVRVVDDALFIGIHFSLCVVLKLLVSFFNTGSNVFTPLLICPSTETSPNLAVKNVKLAVQRSAALELPSSD